MFFIVYVHVHVLFYTLAILESLNDNNHQYYIFPFISLIDKMIISQ